MRARLRAVEVDPRGYARLAQLALAALTLIVLTGAAVRLTGSGLGCPDWPRCYGRALPPLDAHALIEYGNRILSGIVSVVVVATFALSFRRRPYRRDLSLLAGALVAGVLAQAVLGGLTVEGDLEPGYVMGHFGLSMLVLVAAVAHAWRAVATVDPPAGRRDPVSVWSVRALLPLAAVAIFAGTAATAAGPHSGGKPGQNIHRLHFEGRNTLDWLIHRHASIAAILGIAIVAVWFLLRARGEGRAGVEPLTVAGVLVAGQGLVGSVQYELHLPADMVWIHVVLASATWIALLWAAAAVGTGGPAGSAKHEVVMEDAPVGRPAHALHPEPQYHPDPLEVP